MKKLSLISIVTFSLLSSIAHSAPFAIAIHGGAGTITKERLTKEQDKAIRGVLKHAVEQGYKVLENGGTSMDAINTSINILENSPYFNAGKGAVYTFDGKHELDASIMDGKTMNAGAVSGVRHILNPINLARKVMTDSVHVMLSGEGAEEFALSQNMPLVPNAIFNTETRYNQLLKAKEKINKELSAGKDYQAAADSIDQNLKYGTVGAVAVDQYGNLAAGTSTGGMTAKRFGRVGDAPIIGAGTFAENESCAVSATGHGEYFIRYRVASDICARVKYKGENITQAANHVINNVLLPVGGTGGVIVVDTDGNITMPFNTSGMYRASKQSTGKEHVAIYRNEK